MTICTPIDSPAQVDKKYVAFKNVYLDFWPKKSLISPHGDAILKKLKIRLNACIILLLLVYLIGTIFFVNIKF
jgi:hypothetical protein